MPSQLTTVPQIKRYLRLLPEQISGVSTPTTADDGLMQALADAVSADIEQYCSRTFALQTYQEVRNGTGTDTLTLTQAPITDVSDVRLVYPQLVAGVDQAATVFVSGVDYTFTTFSVVRYGGIFPRGTANVQVTYQAGFASLPADIVHAATKWAAVRYREFERLGMKSVSIQGQTTSFDLSDLPPDVEGILDRYQKNAIITHARVTVLS